MIQQQSRVSTFVSELRRRRVFRVAAVYGGVAFVLFQIIDSIFEPLHIPEWIGSLIIILLLVGFPLAMALAWVFDITPEGIVRTEGRSTGKPGTSNRALMAVTIAAVAFGIWGWMRDGGTVGEIRSIAVLPLDNLMGDPDQDYFVDGMHEALIADLSKIDALRVISRTSVMQYKGVKKPSLPEIARELGVSAVVEGSILRSENQIRITVQLIGIDPERHLWSHSYEREYRDILNLQREVAQDIARKIRIAVTPEEESRMAYRPIENVQAYESYLKARYNLTLFTKEALDRAMVDLGLSQEILGDNALIYASMAYVYWQYVNIGAGQETYLDLAEEYAEKALKLDPQSSEGHVVLGLVNIAFRGNVKKGLYHFKRALAINPNNPDALFWAPVGYTLVGKTAEAYALVDRLLEIDPLTPTIHILPGLLSLMSGQFETAVELGEKYYRMDTQNPMNHLFYPFVLAYNQQLDEASALFDNFTDVDLNNSMTGMGFILQAALAGDTGRMEELLTPDLNETLRRDAQFSWMLASIYVMAGQNGKALTWLENAVDRGFVNYPFLADHDPFIKKLQGEERFQRLMKRVKYEWEHFDD
ncbi:MAG: hypothetical protein IIA59_13665 [Candidatus Marinimicrobia bacterium]|nr:hypothetical protein [Candidatus Neomarinimicrobiota bacterium]